mmetsp:Transcript_21503/g.43075  ORF Transcript_21503/g.43075 Transcript_21503/m.43075 type:complete len:234 (-) Transcript_21503:93-794(-)
MIKGRFLLSGTIGALLVISNTANGISDPDFISEVKAARKKQKQLFDIKGFAKTPECLHKKKTTSMFKESLKCPHKEMQASLSKKTPKFLRKVSEVYSVCLDCEDHEILGCNCHPSCSECGWDETFECDMDHEEETGPGNCFACADGSEVVPLHDLNSGDTLSHGICSDSSACYHDCGETDCECDANCSICEKWEEDDGEEGYECLVCKDGAYIWNDCWGYLEPVTCGYNQPQN